MLRGLNKKQLVEYAKEKPSGTVKIAVLKDGEYIFSGYVLDEYYTFIVIPCFGDRFMTFDTLEERITGNITFDILSFESYRENVIIDYRKHGRDIPKHFMEVPF